MNLRVYKNSLLAVVFSLLVATISLYQLNQPVQAALGDASEPAQSCLQIKDANPAATDGLYWIKTPTMTSAKQFYCDMTTDGGGWQLVFHRRGGSNNVEECGNTLNEFLHNGACGDVNNLGYDKSYISENIDDIYNHFKPNEYMFKQFDSTMNFDSDDAYIIHSDANLFPDSPSPNIVQDIPVDKICDIDNQNCDDTDGYWKYIGNSWFHSALCLAGNSANSTSLNGNYGYCHNGWSGGYANSLFGNRNGYNETKLYRYNSVSRFFAERVFTRSNPPKFDKITTVSDNAKNTLYAKAGDKIKMTISLVEADTWRSSYNHLTFNIGATTGLTTPNFLGKTTPKLEGYRNYTILDGQNGTLTFTDLQFQNRDEIDIIGFNAPYIPNPNVIVDTILPTVNFIDDVSSTITASDTINITVNDANPDAASYKYGFSTDATCDDSDTYSNNFTNNTSFNITDSSHNGQYLCVRVEDMAGNVSFKASANPLKIGQKTATPLAAPDLKASSDSGSSDSDDITNDTTPTITGSCLAGSTIKIYVDGADTGDTATCQTDGTFEATLTNALTNGNHAITYTQKLPGAANFESDQSPALNINIDTINPNNLTINVNIQTPHDTDNPLITFGATDNESGIDYYTIQIDGGSITTVTSPYEPSLPTATTHTVVVVAYDKAGNSITQTVQYPPVINITSPTVISNAAITDSTFTVDGPNPITEITVNGPAGTSFTCDQTPSTATPIQGPINCTLNVPTTGTVTINATDGTSVGNASQDYIVETIAPVIVFDQDVTNTDPVQSTDIQVTVTDDNLDVNQLFYGFSADATCDASDIYPNTLTNGGVFTLNDESHNGQYLCVKATDKAGNVAYKVSGNPILIDITAPILTLNGANEITIEQGDTYTDLGVVCNDNIDPTCQAISNVNIVDINTIGTYIVTYRATDIAGNSTTINRTIKVKAKKVDINNGSNNSNNNTAPNTGSGNRNLTILISSTTLIFGGLLMLIFEKN